MLKGYLILLIILITYQQCYIFDDTWFYIEGDVIMASSRSNVLWSGVRLNDIMLWGNSKIAIAPFHSFMNFTMHEVGFTNTGYIMSYIFQYKNYTFNTSRVEIAENTASSNINITHTYKSGLLSPATLCMSSMALPGKISSTNTWGFFIIELFYVSILFLAIIYRNSDPLRSRASSLYICCIGSFIYSLIDYIEASQSFEWYTLNGCFLDAFLLYPSQQLTFFLPIALYFRYLCLLNLNISKAENADNEDIVSAMKWYHRLFYYCTNKYILLGLTICYVSLFEIIMMAETLSPHPQCTVEVITAHTYTHLAFSALCASMFILLLFLDWVPNIILLIRGKYKNLLFTDPYLFRLDQLAIILLVISFFLWASGQLGKLGNMIIIEIAFLMTLAINGGISLIITIYKNLYGMRKQSHNKLDVIFSNINGEIAKMFKKYCEREWSVENFMCMEAITKYQNAKTSERGKLGEFIVALYLNHQSQFEVNIPNSTRNKTKQALISGEHNDDTLSDLKDEITRNLNDTYSRFLYCKEYVEYMHLQESIESKKKIINN